jgi:hypothetical protein
MRIHISEKFASEFTEDELKILNMRELYKGEKYVDQDFKVNMRSFFDGIEEIFKTLRFCEKSICDNFIASVISKSMATQAYCNCAFYLGDMKTKEGLDISGYSKTNNVGMSASWKYNRGELILVPVEDNDKNISYDVFIPIESIVISSSFQKKSKLIVNLEEQDGYIVKNIEEETVISADELYRIFSERDMKKTDDCNYFYSSNSFENKYFQLEKLNDKVAISFCKISAKQIEDRDVYISHTPLESDLINQEIYQENKFFKEKFEEIKYILRGQNEKVLFQRYE